MPGMPDTRDTQYQRWIRMAEETTKDQGSQGMDASCILTGAGITLLRSRPMRLRPMMFLREFILKPAAVVLTIALGAAVLIAPVGVTVGLLLHRGGQPWQITVTLGLLAGVIGAVVIGTILVATLQGLQDMWGQYGRAAARQLHAIAWASEQDCIAVQARQLHAMAWASEQDCIAVQARRCQDRKDSRQT